jgi:hypothetical protein
MPNPILTPEQVSRISGLVARYITEQRQRYEPHAVPLSGQQKAAMLGFFSPQLLDGARLLVLTEDSVSNPDFYPMLQGMGFTNLPDFSLMSAITFYDLVVSHRLFSAGLLFHELVHVEQYRQLGIPRFAELYVHGFLKGGGYDSIPLELNAYMLGGWYESNLAQRFLVTNEVREWIIKGKF